MENQWISVKDKLPENFQEVLTIDKLNVCRVMHIWRDRWHDGCDTSYAPDYVTHWMPLPEPPKELDADHRKQRGRTAPNGHNS